VHRVKDPLPVQKDDIQYDYRIAGYWRIAQTFQCRRLSLSERGQTSGPLLEVTFAPVWVDFFFCKKKKKTTKRVGSQSPTSTIVSSSAGSSGGASRDYSTPSESGSVNKRKKLKTPSASG
jgi:hypothetical protein